MLQLSKLLYRSHQIEVNLFVEEFHQIFHSDVYYAFFARNTEGCF